MHSKIDPELANDLLQGADAIAHFVFGDRSAKRKIYYLVEHSRIPVFRLGSMLCARRSVLMAWIAAQERKTGEGAPCPT